jgi:hypothetical protein
VRRRFTRIAVPICFAIALFGFATANPVLGIVWLVMAGAAWITDGE